jgi:hypothetical protein
MSDGNVNIFRSAPSTNSWRAITGEWPDAPWFEHRGHRRPHRESKRALANATSASQSGKCEKECGDGQ